MMTSIAEAFTKAQLEFKLVDLGARRVTNPRDQIFRMTILTRRHGRPKEYFFINLGDGTVRVEVVDVNTKHRQVLFLVKEEVRSFTDRVWSDVERRWKEVVHTTNGDKRKILAGMDETHLFMAVLPNVVADVGRVGAINTVEAAHRVLKPRNVIVEERQNTGIKRQGEWFFIPVTDEEIEEIEKGIKIGLLKRKESLGWGGKPHVADQVVTINNTLFATGKIRHPDHRTVKLYGWYRVVRNTEDRNSVVTSGSVRWID